MDPSLYSSIDLGRNIFYTTSCYGWAEVYTGEDCIRRLCIKMLYRNDYAIIVGKSLK